MGLNLDPPTLPTTVSSPNNHRNRSSVLEALRHAASTFAGHRAQVMLMRSVKFLVAAFLLLCVADAAIHLGSGARFGLILLVGTAILTLLVIAGLVAFLARPKADQMANILEKRNSSFGSKLTNILELHEQAEDSEIDPMTRDLAKLAVTDATHKIDTAEVRTIAKSPHRRREFKWAAAILAVFVLIPFISGEAGRRQFLRSAATLWRSSPAFLHLVDDLQAAGRPARSCLWRIGPRGS